MNKYKMPYLDPCSSQDESYDFPESPTVKIRKFYAGHVESECD